MLNGKPPSSRPPPPAETERLEAARGELRDALGALRNLAQLLRSLRTGPKALASVLPDVHASCASLARSMQYLLEAVAAHLPPGTSAIDALTQWTEPRIRELDLQLSEAASRPVNAKNRIALEQIVTRLSRDLDGARELIQLMEAAIWEPRVRLDLLELARVTFKAGAQSGGTTQIIAATLSRDAPGTELYVNPRVATSLLAIGLQLVAGAGGPSGRPHVSIERRPTGDSGFTVSGRGGEGELLVLEARRILPPTLACAQAVASLSDARLECADDHREIAVLWSPVASVKL